MVSAHPNGQIFADSLICPYYFMGEESIHVIYIMLLLTHLGPKVIYKNGQIPLNTVTGPSFV